MNQARIQNGVLGVWTPCKYSVQKLIFKKVFIFILFYFFFIIILFIFIFYFFIFIIFFLKTHIKPACNRNSEERELMSVTVKSHAIYKKSRYLNPHLHITKTPCPALFTEQNPKSVWKKHRLGVQARDLIGWKPYFGVLLHRLGVQTRDVIGCCPK